MVSSTHLREDDMEKIVIV